MSAVRHEHESGDFLEGDFGDDFFERLRQVGRRAERFFPRGGGGLRGGEAARGFGLRRGFGRGGGVRFAAGGGVGGGAGRFADRGVQLGEGAESVEVQVVGFGEARQRRSVRRAFAGEQTPRQRRARGVRRGEHAFALRRAHRVENGERARGPHRFGAGREVAQRVRRGAERADGVGVRRAAVLHGREERVEGRQERFADELGARGQGSGHVAVRLGVDLGQEPVHRGGRAVRQRAGFPRRFLQRRAVEFGGAFGGGVAHRGKAGVQRSERRGQVFERILFRNFQHAQRRRHVEPFFVRPIFVLEMHRGRVVQEHHHAALDRPLLFADQFGLHDDEDEQRDRGHAAGHDDPAHAAGRDARGFARVEPRDRLQRGARDQRGEQDVPAPGEEDMAPEQLEDRPRGDRPDRDQDAQPHAQVAEALFHDFVGPRPDENGEQGERPKRQNGHRGGEQVGAEEVLVHVGKGAWVRMLAQSPDGRKDGLAAANGKIGASGEIQTHEGSPRRFTKPLPLVTWLHWRRRMAAF